MSTNIETRQSIYEKKNLRAFYNKCRKLEQENKNVLLDFQNDYPGVLNGDNLAAILKAAKAKKQDSLYFPET